VWWCFLVVGSSPELPCLLPNYFQGCDRAAQVLTSPAYKLKPEEVEVVRLNGAQMHVMEYVDKLASSPPNKTPPYVFVDGVYIGGWPELQRRHEAKELAPLLLAPTADKKDAQAATAAASNDT